MSNSLYATLKSYINKLITWTKFARNVRTWFNNSDNDSGDTFEFEIPSGLKVKAIPNYAFAINTNLMKVVLPDSIEKIGYYSFSESGLKDISLTEGLVSIGGGAFSSTPLSEISLPKTLESIGDYAFQESSVTSVVIPDSVTSIGQYLFYNCSELESATIGSGIESIGGRSFYKCSALTTVNLSEGLKDIGDYTFYNCTSLSGLDIPNTVTSIGQYAFYNCSSLEKLTFTENITSIPTNLCYNCSGLKSITIPENISSISKGSFAKCYNISELNFNASNITNAVYSSDKVFAGVGTGCDGVEISIGANVASIPANIFYSTSTSDFLNALSVTFADESVCTSIGNYAFRGLKNVESMEIPASVTSIGNNAFPTCLTQLILNCAEGDIDGSPWGATNAEIVYSG